MSADGWTKSYRRKWWHPAFKDFRDVGIWSYLVDNAAWADDTRIRFDGYPVTLMRGDVAVSERFLAVGFCCDRQVIRRILETLEQHRMITRRKTHKATVVTICNYDEYQSSSATDKPTTTFDQTHAKPTLNPNIEESKKVKKEDLDIVPSELLFDVPINIDQDAWGSINGNSSAEVADAVFEKWFWPLYPDTKGAKRPALLKFRSSLKYDNAENILFGLSQYARKREDENKPQFTKRAVTWLNQRCWQDELREFENAD